ncbi:MAG TPA: hypothetical protein OIM03_00990 [Veillonellaceae bacterium]|nr:hypothetical protein [Veillonellaceae bacterium]
MAKKKLGKDKTMKKEKYKGKPDNKEKGKNQTTSLKAVGNQP